jgi:ketosteroid isomerase-like protein
MSAENVDVIRRGYEHLRETGEPLSENWHPDFVWDMSTFRGWPEEQTYLGREGYERFMRNWLEPFDDWHLDVERYVDAGDQVVVIQRQRGTSKSSGVEVDMRFAQVWTVRNGKQVRVELYADPDEALAAAGVTE